MKTKANDLGGQLKATQVGLSPDDKKTLEKLAKENERTLSAQIRYIIKLMIEDK